MHLVEHLAPVETGLLHQRVCSSLYVQALQHFYMHHMYGMFDEESVPGLKRAWPQFWAGCSQLTSIRFEG